MVALIILAALSQINQDTVLDSRLHDARFYRRVQEAKVQACKWAFGKCMDLFPGSEMARVSLMNPRESQKLRRLQAYAEKVLRDAAYKQIEEAYEITEREFVNIVMDPRTQGLRHEPERLQVPGDHQEGQPIRMVLHSWEFERTRFNPDLVFVKPEIAKLIRYQNPKKPGKPEVFSKEAIERGAEIPKQSRAPKTE